MLVAQGQLAEALNAYRAGLAIAERLAVADPGNAPWQRDLSVSHEKLGDVLVAQGQLAEALKAYRAEAQGAGNAGAGTATAERRSAAGGRRSHPGTCPAITQVLRESSTTAIIVLS